MDAYDIPAGGIGNRNVGCWAQERERRESGGWHVNM